MSIRNPSSKTATLQPSPEPERARSVTFAAGAEAAVAGEVAAHTLVCNVFYLSFECTMHEQNGVYMFL